MRHSRNTIDTLERSASRARRSAPATRQYARAHNRSRGRRYRWAALGLLVCAVTVAVVLAVRVYDYRDAQREYAQYREALASAPVPTEAPTLLPAMAADTSATPAQTATPIPTPTPEPYFSDKVHGFLKQNSDTVAYLDVPDTTVQYPVVQGKDNEYYLTHTFAGKRRAAGAIFLDAWNSGDLSDFNTVIYGHNMKDGSMFHPLRDYRKKEFLSGHKYIELTLLRSHRTYKVFAAYVVEDDFDFRGFGCVTEAERAAFIKRILYRSEINTNATATADDTILTLVTCTSGEQDWFWVVHAVLVEEVTTEQ